MDPNLTFDNHVLETVSSCMPRLDQINRVKYSFDKQSLIDYYKLLAETMHDVSNDLMPSNLKDLFVPTAKIHSYNTRASVSRNFYIQKSNTEIQRKSLSRIGAKLWNEIPTKLRALPKASFEKKIQMILLKILENEDSYKDLEFIISKLNFTFHSCTSFFCSNSVLS